MLLRGKGDGVRLSGWKKGEGLGKDKMGELEPLKLDIKIDRRGQYTFEEEMGGGK